MLVVNGRVFCKLVFVLGDTLEVGFLSDFPSLSFIHVSFAGSPTAASGAVGAPAVSNYSYSRFVFPGCRFGHSVLSITEGPMAGTTFMVGGFGLNAGTSQGFLSDLWAFRSDSGWALVGGQLAINSNPVFGVQGVPSVLNNLGASFSGNLFQATMFGNARPFIYIYGGTSSSVLWRFHTVNRVFTYLGGNFGSAAAVANGVMLFFFSLSLVFLFFVTDDFFKGGLDSFSALNTPGARSGAVGLTVGTRHLLVGGTGTSISGVSGSVCTVWEFREAGEWAVIDGPLGSPNELNCAPNVASGTFGGRTSLLATSLNGRAFFGFGGSSLGAMADLWEFDLTTDSFVFVAGSTTGNFPGVFGAPGSQGAGFAVPGRSSFASSSSVGRLALDGSGDAEFFVSLGTVVGSVVGSTESKQTTFLLRLVIPPTTTVLTTAQTTVPGQATAWCASSFGGALVGGVCEVCCSVFVVMLSKRILLKKKLQR